MNDQRWLGIAVKGTAVTLVDLLIDGSGKIATIESDTTMDLHEGDAPDAYAIMFQRVSSYVGEHPIDHIVVKGSAVSGGPATLALLTSAELRGVVIAACASKCEKTTLRTKAATSKGFGKRKVDEYLSDDSFWKEQLNGLKLRKGSREAALLVLAEAVSE